MAIAASLLMMFEFMHFSIGRTASIEPFVTLFLLIEYFSYIVISKHVNQGLLLLLFYATYSQQQLVFHWRLPANGVRFILPLLLFCILIYGELIKQKLTILQG